VDAGLLSVVVPAYREGPTIYAALGLLLDSLRALGRPFEVIVVSDGSDDDTVAEALRHGPPVRVCQYDEQRGKGHAVRFGINEAQGEFIAFIDADMELHPDAIAGLLARVEAGADAAIASKRHPESVVDYPLFRRVQSGVYQWVIRRLFSLHLTDTQAGLKVFRASAVKRAAAPLESDGFAFDLELLVALQHQGSKIVEGPVRLNYQFATTTTLRAAADVLVDTARIWRRHHRRRRRAEL